MRYHPFCRKCDRSAQRSAVLRNILIPILDRSIAFALTGESRTEIMGKRIMNSEYRIIQKFATTNFYRFSSLFSLHFSLSSRPLGGEYYRLSASARIDRRLSVTERACFFPRHCVFTTKLLYHSKIDLSIEIYEKYLIF